jgi:hypothetical protein
MGPGQVMLVVRPHANLFEALGVVGQLLILEGISYTCDEEMTVTCDKMRNDSLASHITLATASAPPSAGCPQQPERPRHRARCHAPPAEGLHRGSTQP